MTRMLLVRHGQSTWNADGRWQGQADPPLSDLGREQAFAASQRLGTIDAIITSDLQRAHETALILSGQLGVGPVVLEPGLRERDAGAWSGLTRDEIEEQFPGYLAEHRRPPGYEEDVDLLERLIDVLDRVEREYEGAEVLIIAHGGLVYALEREHDRTFERLPNLGGLWLEHHGDRLTLGERILLIDAEGITTVPHQI